MSHELPAAGGGFIWPELTFASDGERIWVSCRPSPPLSTEPVRYLSDFETFIPAANFEDETDNFMDLVLRRLDARDITELHVLWREVLAERNDPIQAAGRRLEALLGYEPDDAPPQLLEELFKLASLAGQGAADEIAPVCAGNNAEGRLREVRGFSTQAGVRGSLRHLPSCSITRDAQMAPWQIAQLLAKDFRASIRMTSEPVPDKELADLLGIKPGDLTQTMAHASPIGLGVRPRIGDEIKLLFRKRNRPARRFEAARFIADYLCNVSDSWLPITDTATARQKLQRAFAAEFLCPIDSLRSYLGEEFSPEALEEAADHFGISELAIKSHLANHRLIPRSLVDSQTTA